MLYIIFQFILLFLVSLSLTALSRFKSLAWMLSVFFGAFLALQMNSVSMGGSFIDYKYYLHTGAVDFGLMRKFFFWESLFGFVAFLLFSVVLYYGSRRLRKWKAGGLPYIGLALLGSILMVVPEGILKELYGIIEMTSVKNTGFDEALASLNIPVSEYVKPESVKATKGKNIIVISLESLEQGFLREPLTHLTPQLNKLAEKGTYFNMLQSPGSGWTSGSVYTSIAGFPSYFKGKGNDIFQSASRLKLAGVGHVLDKAGYDLTYLLGKKDFAGTDKMLEAYQFEVRSEVDFEGKYPKSAWGLHDKDLFAEAKEVLLEKQKGSQPFALFLSTISTHLPKGVYDYRMKEMVKPQRSELEFMVAAVDHMIGDFVDFLDKEGLLENTSFYIYPDHLIMGSSPVILDDFGDLRELYLITNAKSKDLSYDPSKKINQLDIPKIILEGAGVKHNVKFLRDFIPADQPSDDFINKHKKEIVALNEASLHTEGFGNGVNIKRSGDKRLLLTSANIKRSFKDLDFSSGKAHVFTFDARKRLIKNEGTTLYEAFETSKFKGGATYLIAYLQEGQLFTYLRTGNRIGVAKKGEESVSYDRADFEVLEDWKFKGDEFRLPTRKSYETPFDMLYLTSGSGGLAELKTPGQIKIGSYKLPIKKGLNLLTKKAGEYQVTHFDFVSNASVVDDLLNSIEKLKQKKEFFALVAQEWPMKINKGAAALDKIGCKVLAKLKPKETYIGYSYYGYISEYKYHKPFSISFPETPTPSQRTQQQIDAAAKDTRKFIAHAGGAIEGNTYTNSLEALNLSYKKGYRLFELDMIKTNDGHYVAAHDWGYWRKHTKYKGRPPVSEVEFLKGKMKGKYTLMGMKTINEWFANHPDAILITDKINEPKQFASEFVDKKRLIMELFTLEAVEEAVEAGVEVIPSEQVLDKIEGDKVEWLQDRGIKQVALSRLKFREKLPFLKALKAKGIKVYFYHVNAEKGKDEAYVLCNDFDWIWGMYADEWSFLNE